MKNIILPLFLLITTTQFAIAQYCSASSSTSSYEWIERVSFGFDKQQTGNNGGYHDGTADVPMHASVGMCFRLTAEPAYSGYEYNEYWGIWMDFNHDGDYNDAGENVYLSATPNNYGISAQIQIPETASAGWTQMRVVMKWGSAPIPCGSFTYGEVEDYTLYIEDGMYSCRNDGASSTWEWIDGVGVGDLFLYNSAPNDGFHVDYCQSYTTDLSTGLSVSWEPGYFGTIYEENISISFDKNNDNFFTEDETFHFSGLAGPGYVDFPIDPSIEPDVCHRFRIQMSYYDAGICHFFSLGEVEEYSVYITDVNNIHTLAEPTSETRRKHNDGDPRQAQKNTAQVYPNPVKDVATINFGLNNEQQTAQISLMDITGKVLFTDTKNKNTNTQQLNLSTLETGTYLLQIRYADHLETETIIVTGK